MSIQINKNGTWQEVSQKELLELVKNRVILQDTEIIFNGKTVVAAKVKGLTFPSDSAIPPPLPTGNTSSGILPPSPPPILAASDQNSPIEPESAVSPLLSEKIPLESIKQNGMRFLRWVLPILKKGGTKAMEAAKKGGELAVEATKKGAEQAVEATKKAAPHVKAQLDKIPVESMKEQAAQQIDKVPGGRKRLAMIAGVVLLLLVGIWWMMPKDKTPVHVSEQSIVLSEITAEIDTNEPDAETRDQIAERLLDEADKETLSLINSGASDGSNDGIERKIAQKRLLASKLRYTKEEMSAEERELVGLPKEEKKTIDRPTIKQVNQKQAEDFSKSETSTKTPKKSFWTRSKANSPQEEIKAFCDKYGSDVKAISGGKTLLHRASQEASVHVVKYLLEQGSSIYAEDNFGAWRPVHYAAMNKDVEVIKLLVSVGADTNARTWQRVLPIHIAASHSSLEVVKFLIEKGEDVNVQDGGKLTPVHHAADNKDANVIKYLIAKGGNPNAEGPASLTPLHYAAKNMNADVAKHLIKAGANVNAKQVNDAGVDANNGTTPLHNAAESGNVKVVKYLIEMGASVNAQKTGRYDSGKTPLYEAVAKCESAETVRLLIDNGANVNLGKTTAIEFDRGKRPIHEAAGNKNIEIIKLLVEKGSQINEKDGIGQTPLHVAVKRNNNNVVKYLVNRGAEINANQRVRTPLIDAMREGDYEMIKFLIEKGADVNAKSNTDDMPIHIAAEGGRLDVVKLLVEKGAYANALGSLNATPVDKAKKGAKYGEEEKRKNADDVVKYLIAKRVDAPVERIKPIITELLKAKNKQKVAPNAIVAKKIAEENINALKGVDLSKTPKDFQAVFLRYIDLYDTWRKSTPMDQMGGASCEFSDDLKHIIRMYGINLERFMP